MTDKQIERERGWVKARLNCTVDNVFKELVAVIESDIRSFNKLADRGECVANHVDDRDVTFSLGLRVASVATNGRTIRATVICGSSEVSRLEIRPKWNETEMHCDLFIEGEKVSTHRASQKIIGDVLFP